MILKFCYNCFILREYYSTIHAMNVQQRKDVIEMIKYQYSREELILRGRMDSLKLVKRERFVHLNMEGVPINMFINNINLRKFNKTIRNDLNYTEPWGCLLIDAPWQVGKNNPMRGVKLQYPTMSSCNIYSLNLSNLKPFSYVLSFHQ